MISTTARHGFGHVRPRIRGRRGAGGALAASVAWPRHGNDRRPDGPRDAQRRRVYLAETPLPSSPLPGLDACARFVDRVVGTLWWHERFPERDLGARPPPAARATAPGRPSSARRTTGPTITLPRRYRTKGGRAARAHPLGARHRLRTPPPRAHVRPRAARRDRRVLRSRARPRCWRRRTASTASTWAGRRGRGPDGRLHYGWDERLRLGKGRRRSRCRRPSTARSTSCHGHVRRATSAVRRCCAS